MPLARFLDRVSASPDGWRAYLVAAVVTSVPTAVLHFHPPHPFWLGDTFPVVPTVVRTFTHGDRDLTGYLAAGDGRWADFRHDAELPHFLRRSPAREGVYSAYPAGMEVFAWPGVLVAAALGRPIERDGVQFAIEREAAAAAGGLCLGLFFLCGLRVGRAGPVLAVTALLATGSVVASTLTQLLWQQTGVVLWALVVLLVELASGWRPGRGGTAVQAVACSLMLACRPSAVTFLVPFGVWVLVRDRRRGVVLPLLAGVAYLPWAAMYHAIYGSPFGPSMAFLGAAWTPAANVGGVLFSPGRGLFVYQPFLLLVPLLLCRGVRTDADRPLLPGWYAFCLAAVGAHLLLVGSWSCWWGGYCWGSRLAAEVVPLGGLLAIRPVGWLARRWWGVAVVATLAAGGIAGHAPYLYGRGKDWNTDHTIDANPARLWDWSDAPFRRW